MTRILAVADEIDEALYGDRLTTIKPDLILSCGDVPFDYLEYLVSRLDVPLLYVPGNHDPDLRPPDTTWSPLAVEVPRPGPEGCVNVDGRVVEAGGLRVGGLGGSIRYRPGPNQYSQARMRWRALRIEALARLKRGSSGRYLDVLLTHVPPEGFGGDQNDLAHRGLGAFNTLIKRLQPAVHVHGHVHPYGVGRPETRLGRTLIVNAVPKRLLEV